MATSKVSFVKKHVTDLAYSVRDELGLGPFQRLEPKHLAEHLAIPLLPLSDVRKINADAAYFMEKETNALSGLTIFDGNRRLIVFNDAHTPARQASDICHELGHGLLQHEPASALDVSGCRDWDQVMEDEAQWAAGALLVHELALVGALRSGRSQAQLAYQLGVSQEMIRWRINMTGAMRRAKPATKNNRLGRAS
jgi:Zn-dependent peptidase ImmA (M78 family)